MPDQRALHNQLGPQILRQLVRPIIESGGTTKDILILTESVLVGVLTYCVKVGGDDKVLDVLFERDRERMADERLSGIKVEGQA